MMIARPVAQVVTARRPPKLMQVRWAQRAHNFAASARRKQPWRLWRRSQQRSPEGIWNARRLEDGARLIGFATVFFAIPVFWWPFFDLFVLPEIMKRNFLSPPFTLKQLKDDTKADDAAEALSTLMARDSRKVVVLHGKHATPFAMKYTMHAARPVGYFSLREMFHATVYEIFCLQQQWGLLGRCLAAYIKLCMFLGSMISKRHPHVDGITYFYNCMNNMHSVLKQLDNPIMLVNHVETLAGQTRAVGREIRDAADFLLHVIGEESILMTHDSQLGSMVLICENLDFLEHPGFCHMKNHIVLAHVDRDTKHDAYVLRESRYWEWLPPRSGWRRIAQFPSFAWWRLLGH